MTLNEDLPDRCVALFLSPHLTFDSVWLMTLSMCWYESVRGSPVEVEKASKRIF